MRQILLLGIAGGIGTLCRYGFGCLCHRFFGHSFAFATLLVNVLGCFAIGFFLVWSAKSLAISPMLKLSVTVGFLGAFTTFSTFGYETFDYLQQQAWGLAMANVLLNVGVGTLAVYLGWRLGMAV